MALTCNDWPTQPHRYSYWLRGFDDGYAGKHEMLPTADGAYEQSNRGYLNGYMAGRQKLNRELMAKLREDAVTPIRELEARLEVAERRAA
jgi:hypothetical protein